VRPSVVDGDQVMVDYDASAEEAPKEPLDDIEVLMIALNSGGC